MTINRPQTFANLKSNFGSLKQSQVDSFNLFFDYWDGFDKRHLAYILATVWHETDKTMLPIEEYGKGFGKPYGHFFMMSKDKKGNHFPYKGTTELFYGRGFVQLTWYENYDKASRLLKQDFLHNAKAVMELKNAMKICFIGMTEGWFTGKKLSDYFNDKKTEPVNARKIINGLDCAVLIKTYYDKFYNSIV